MSEVFFTEIASCKAKDLSDTGQADIRNPLRCLLITECWDKITGGYATMNKKQKKMLATDHCFRGVTDCLVFPCFRLTGYVRDLGCYMAVPYLVIGYDILKKAWKGILNRPGISMRIS